MLFASSNNNLCKKGPILEKMVTPMASHSQTANNSLQHVCILPKFLYWNPNPQSDGIRRWNLWGLISHMGRPLKNGISVLTKEAQDISFFSSTCEDLMRTVIYEEWALTRHRVCRCLDLGLNLKRYKKWTFVIYQQPSIWYIVTASWTDEDMAPHYWKALQDFTLTEKKKIFRLI